MSPSPNVLDIGPGAYLDVADSLPFPAVADGRLSLDVHRRYRDTLHRREPFRGLAEELNCDLSSAAGARGYAIVQLPPTMIEDLRLPTAICSLAGRPFRLVTRLPLWQEMHVDLDAEPHRFGGVGYNPFHIDLVNASDPPSFTCLLSMRADPVGGGQSILSNLRQAVQRLDGKHVERLAEPVFREGRFYDLFGVGRELTRFAVVARHGSDVRVRFTGKLDLPPGPHRDAVKALNRELVNCQERFMLRPGQLLIINNLTMAHGREALGRAQSRVPTERRRFLRQTYLHALDASTGRADP